MAPAQTTPRQLTLEQAAIVTEKKRRSANTDRILAALERAGAAGLTNEQLMEVGGYRFGARLLELKKSGHAWGKEHLGGGLWRYYLVKEKAA